jgi:tetratricopeptide (TPR) repeat protein
MITYLTEALTTCEQLLSQPATLDWLHACQTVGNILTSMGLIEEAGQWHRMALDETPNEARFYQESNRIYTQCEAWDEALQACQRLLEQQPDNLYAHYWLTKIYHHQGNYTAEMQALNHLLTLQPEGATDDGHLQLGRLLQARGLHQEALQCYQRALEHQPDTLATYYALGELWGKLGQWDQAIQLLQPLVDRFPEEARIHYHLGRAYRQQQQHKQAIVYFRQALKLDPQLHWAYIGYLNSLMQLDQWDEVVKGCQAILTHLGESPWVYCFLGNAWSRQGDHTQAIACHQKSFALRGWTQCTERQYEFTQTWFSEIIPLWEIYLMAWNQAPDRPPRQVLSLGVGDGSSLCWLVDQVLVKPDDRLICLAPQFSQPLQQNLAKLANPDRVILQAADPAHSLTSFTESNPDSPPFDLIYVQTDHKTADYLYHLATQHWPLLRVSGLLIFRDYPWQHPTDPQQSARVGIDRFLASVTGQVEILHQSGQVMLRKTEVA